MQQVLQKGKLHLVREKGDDRVSPGESAGLSMTKLQSSIYNEKARFAKTENYHLKEYIVMAKKTHLTDADRLQIEIMLKQRYSLTQIATVIGKAKSTVAREIKKRALESDKFAAHYPQNRCVRRRECHRVQLC